jgi:hypothetical protein
VSTVDIYATSGGAVILNNTTMAAVYDGTYNWSSATDNGTTVGIGIRMDVSDYQSTQMFVGFDTSTTNIPAGATINSVALSLVATEDWPMGGAGDAILEAYIYDWSGSGIAEADFRTHTALASLYTSPGRMASLDVSTIDNALGPTTLPLASGAAFASSLSGTTTYLVIVEQQGRLDSAFSAQARIIVGSDDNATQAYRPKITVDYTVAEVQFSGLIVTRRLQG